MKKFVIIIELIILWLSFVICFSGNWAVSTFSFSNFDEILYTLTSPVLNAGQNLIPDFIFNNIIFPLLIVGFISLIIYICNTYRKKYNILVKIELGKKKKKLEFDLFNNVCFKILKVILCVLPIVFFVLSFYKLGNDLKLFEYIKNQTEESTFIEEVYVNPNEVELTFSENKRNLIYIYLESMESTFSSIENGGAYEENYISKLSKLAFNNTYFSNTELLGGAYSMPGTNWTIAGMVAQTAGIPIKTIFDGNMLTDYYSVLFPGAYSLGEILEENGYKNYVMFGSDAAFAGRDNYFLNHGNYEILDYYQAKEDDIIADDYYVFWGFEDDILYDYAKEKLLEISENDEPFNFTILTVDTHASDGYLSDFCEEISDNKYLNAINCASYQLNEFINWIKKQDFYKNTTIIISGDHISMNNYSFDNIGAYQRTIFNTFINYKVQNNIKNYYNRLFTAFDMYPTTLAALNVEIKGNRLGLGVNLFSDEQTLLEEYGYAYVYNELNKKSTFYNNCILNGEC